ncbi:MAG: hypothetical protein LKI17_06210 [Megasphaera cerevisiae]|jgi:hypothetical protein|nr:hypothetical protein [Megasphaera cerevisiae]
MTQEQKNMVTLYDLRNRATMEQHQKEEKVLNWVIAFLDKHWDVVEEDGKHGR